MVVEPAVLWHDEQPKPTLRGRILETLWMSLLLGTCRRIETRRPPGIARKQHTADRGRNRESRERTDLLRSIGLFRGTLVRRYLRRNGRLTEPRHEKFPEGSPNGQANL